MKPEVWAAWAQAVLSAAAIFAAGLVAGWQMKSADRKRVDACVMAIAHASDSLRALAAAARDRVNLTGANTLPLEIAETSDEVLRAIAIDTVPEVKLYTPLAAARIYSSMALSTARSLNDAMAKGHTMTNTNAALFDSFAKEIEELRNKALQVSRLYRPWWIKLLSP